jgi:hypothetical protein
MRAWVLCSSAALLLFLHLPFLSRPYFWDEAGQFIPASLDIYYSGELVPHSTIPNVHPPAVMLWLAGTWRVFGYSIVTTRLAMLVIALAGCWWVYRLAAEFLCEQHAAAGVTLALLCLSPLYFSQSIMALLDLPATALTALALLLFLRERLAMSALACVMLVMVKETGALLPAVLGVVLIREKRRQQATLFLLPALPLIGWLALLHARTGDWFGNSVFAQYNLEYPLNPVRLAMAVLRRGYYLFIGTGYLIGSVALLKTRRLAPRSRSWRIAGTFALAHFVAMCMIGGAVLERYLLPILPIVLAAFANAICRLSPRWRNSALAAMGTCSVMCIMINPIYPFPLENNLAWADFVSAHQQAARYLNSHLAPDATIATSFPFGNCMRLPELGYTDRRFVIDDLPDFTRASLDTLRGRRIDALAVFTSTWDPLGLERGQRWIEFMRRFYRYQPDVTPAEIPALLGMHSVARFERHGQWIEIFEP